MQAYSVPKTQIQRFKFLRTLLSSTTSGHQHLEQSLNDKSQICRSFSQIQAWKIKIYSLCQCVSSLVCEKIQICMIKSVEFPGTQRKYLWNSCPDSSSTLHSPISSCYTVSQSSGNCVLIHSCCKIYVFSSIHTLLHMSSHILGKFPEKLSKKIG